MALNQLSNDTNAPESSKGTSANRRMWDLTWKLPVQNKIKNFIWRCLRGFISSKKRLQCKGLTIDSICDHCGAAEEDLEHLFFKCPRAQICWKISGLQWNKITDHPNFSFAEWWSNICNDSSLPAMTDRISLSTYLMWWLWKTRNNWLFNKEKCSEVEVVRRATHDWNEFTDVGLQVPTTIIDKMSNNMTPLEEFFPRVGQISISASALPSLDGCVVFAAVAKSEDLTLLEWNESYMYEGDELGKTLCLVRWILEKAIQAGWSDILCKITKKGLAKQLKRRQNFSWKIHTVAEDIYSLANLLSSCEFADDVP
ncbi:Ribonuclease H-like superfamily protein [Striga hermonthica]|uniref:Ribonuclease H-like superfamily protein n=1 Tax=Striga hermonthica TaxID=68872 RepID=A0A9N7RMK3_STRHE|nr:Ribonuclease H-like superfamily protein [Striga hermonthica]